MEQQQEPEPYGTFNSIAIRRQAMMVLLGNVGILAAGLTIGLPTVTMAVLTGPESSIGLSVSQFTWFASINLIVSPLGCLLNAIILDRVGCKRTMYILNLWILLGWIIMAISVTFDGDTVFALLMLARIITGVGTGMASTPVGIYAAEICNPHIRGRFIMGPSTVIALGSSAVYCLGGLLTRENWKYIGLIPCIYQIISILCIIPMPETPNWLISKGRMAEAQKSFNYFRGLNKTDAQLTPALIAEFAILKTSIELRTHNVSPTLWSLLHLPEMHRPLALIFMLFVLQQLSGVVILFVYAAQLSEMADVPISGYLCAIGVGCARLLTTIALVVILDRWGRRRLLLISCMGMAVCMTVLSASQGIESLWPYVWLPLIMILAYTIFATLGIFTMPFILVSEIFPPAVRGQAAGFSVALGMMITFICVKMFLPTMDVIGDTACFGIFAFVAFMGIIYVYYVVPETKGHTLDTIQENFRLQGSMVAPRRPTAAN